MILTDRVELLSQAGGSLSQFGLFPDLIAAGSRHVDFRAPLFVAMVETLNRRIGTPRFERNLGHIDLLIIDEAHKGNFRKVLPHFPNSYIVGATATPISSSKKFPLCDFFDDIVEGPQIPDLIEQGFLVPARVFGSVQEIGKLKVKNGEYTEASLMQYFNKASMYDEAVDKYLQFAKGKKAICFNVNVEHSIKQTEDFNRRGVRAVHVDGNTPKEQRAQILRDFKDGFFEVLCNVGITTTGFDEPSVECIILNRRTKSLPLYLQMNGRGSRLFPGKDHFVTIDMGSNFVEHGHWSDRRDWTELFFNPRRPDPDAVAPVKQCPICQEILPTFATICPECEFEFPIEKKENKVGEFSEVEQQELLVKPWRDLTVRELDEVRKLKGYKVGWVVRQLLAKPGGEQNLFEYAKAKGYKPGWAERQLQFNQVQEVQRA